ncbi:hypothetical protein [uncultured Campylobacter sp.]|uniref:hypothetical protein n=1 Tax=uncultured Campylobacter sp. TaxID=218934 RepID=UPI0026349D35|nr:hypothetical protein [uncultured Campylobacter sp.]
MKKFDFSGALNGLLKGALLAALALFLNSCSANDPRHDPLKNEFSAYTQKFESVRAGDRYLAVATYLNPVAPELRNAAEDEVFLLTSYPKEVQILAVQINGVNANVTSLHDGDPLLQKELFKIAWASRYKITAPKSDKDELVLSYRTSNGLDATMKFRKISKSLYWQPQIDLKD